MNDLKRRKRGFLAALLAAVLILGTPGVAAMAASYDYSQLSVGMELQVGDQVAPVSCGNIYLNGSQVSKPYTIPSSGIKVDKLSYGSIYLISASDPAAGYYRSLAALVSAIKIEGGETHGYGIGSALPYSVMKALADNPDDVLVFETDYKGYHYEFTIQVGEDVKDKITPEIPWYGPYWLAKYFYKTTVIEKLPDYS